MCVESDTFFSFDSFPDVIYLLKACLYQRPTSRGGQCQDREDTTYLIVWDSSAYHRSEKLPHSVVQRVSTEVCVPCGYCGDGSQQTEQTAHREPVEYEVTKEVISHVSPHLIAGNCCQDET